MQKMRLFTWMFLLAVFLPSLTLAEGTLSSDPEDRLSTVPHDAAMQTAVKESDLDLLAIQHEGWTETLPSYARLKLYEITGRTYIPRQDPSYSILSMIYEPLRWEHARILPVEHPDLLEAMALDHKWVTPTQVAKSPKLNEVLAVVQAFNQKEQELTRTRKLLNAVEQAHRLGREERVLTQKEIDGIMASEIEALLDNGDLLAQTHEQRRTLEREIKAERPFASAAQRLLVRTQAFGTLSQTFLLVPDSESVTNDWIRPASFAPADRAMTIMESAREFDDTMARAFATSAPDLLAPAARQFLDSVERSRHYPTEQFRSAQNFYVKINPYRTAAWIYLLTAAIFGVFVFFQNRAIYWAGFAMLLAGFGVHCIGIGVRLYLKGHVPVSNMFEAVTFTSGCVMLIAICIEGWQRRAMVGIGSAIVSFLLLIGAGLMPLHETRIHPLRAVLNSYWLNIHVTMMLVSYAAFAIAAFFALLYVVRSLSAREAALTGIVGGVGGTGLLGLYWLMTYFEGLFKTASGVVNMIFNAVEITFLLTGGLLVIAAALAGLGYGIGLLLGRFGASESDVVMSQSQTEEFAYRLVQLGWPILTLGITLGGVWADTAWGRFWGWDPKETWAFITWVTYTVYLHMRMVMGWRGRWSAAACLLGFIMVLITWFGVSYIPWFSGGLHSYASPT